MAPIYSKDYYTLRNYGLLHFEGRLLGLNTFNVGVVVGKPVKPRTGKSDAMVPEKRWPEAISRVKQFYRRMTFFTEITKSINHLLMN